MPFEDPRKRSRLRILGLGIATVLAVVAVGAWAFAPRPPMASIEIHPKVGKTPAKRVERIESAAWAVDLWRPLVDAPVEEKTEAPLALRLVSIIDGPDGRMAAIDHGGDGLRYLRVGEELGGCTVTAIGPAAVTLEVGGRERSLEPAP